MTLTELKRVLRHMDASKKDEIILAYYKSRSKEEKELLSLYVSAVDENRELPSPKAVVTDPKEVEEVIKSLRKQYSRYTAMSRRTTAVRRLIRKVKDILKVIPLMPTGADKYDALCDTFRILYFDICGGMDSGLWAFAREDLNTSKDELFRTYASMVLAKGINVAALNDLVEVIRKSATRDWFERYRLFEILISWIRNGDLRFEMIEQQETMLLDLKNEKEEMRPGLRSDRMACRAMFYLFLMQAEGTAEGAFAWLEKNIRPGFGEEMRRVWNSCVKAAKEEEAIRLAKMAHDNDEEDGTWFID